MKVSDCLINITDFDHTDTSQRQLIHAVKKHYQAFPKINGGLLATVFLTIANDRIFSLTVHRPKIKCWDGFVDLLVEERTHPLHASTWCFSTGTNRTIGTNGPSELPCNQPDHMRK